MFPHHRKRPGGAATARTSGTGARDGDGREGGRKGGPPAAAARLCAALADGAASGCRSRGPAGGVRDEDGEGAPRPRAAAAADPQRGTATPRHRSRPQPGAPAPRTNAFRGSNRKTNRVPLGSRLPKLGQSRRSKNIFGRSDLMNDSTTIDNVMNTESG
ncbi:unnamed protein product [Nyctereutes procyonoides]|uniref:(raccoon dog) hypothetical protein n=1 Tax=Nyctereutes procyonoides TaxID=34880 RepID=A0A811YRG5_NYCPR|nr:unnamed protein product [Nyctereutes procyonoides]